MRPGPPSPFAALAAATTPIVAAALLAFGVVAGGCDVRTHGTPAIATATPAETGAPGTPATPAESGAPGTASGTPAGPAAGRLLVVTGSPDAPRADVIDPGDGPAGHRPLALPPDAIPLVAVAVAPDGRLAAVTADGRTWVAGPSAADGGSDPAWRRRGTALAAGALPVPVLDATWSRDGRTLLLLAGDAGSGIRRTAVLSVPAAGAAAIAEVPFEVNGPGFAALPDGRVALVGRDRLDRETLVRMSAAGDFTATPAPIRGVAAGGDLVVLVGDGALLAGTLADLDHGALPADPLPLPDAAGIGRIAVAPDGTAVAVVRLDEAGDPVRVEVLRRTGHGWEAAGMLPLAPGTPSALVAWIP